ncbi:ABC transporter permease [Thalassobacillus sp. C254]|uniref:ABC transporter permease n=1 Tax=Thalassobacillus sp. C254 TaxID=1225341 RepID=UPI0006CF6FC7|nr:ABC transporter permease [Thalassobacillus sp. C254]
MFILKKYFRDIKESKDLIWYLTISDFKSQSARTYIGFIWWILDPILYMMIFYFLVQVILQRGGEDYAVFLFVGLIPLKWTMACLVDSTTAISSKVRILQQIYVPKIVFITVRLCTNTLKFLVSSVMMFLFLLVYGVDVTTLAFYYFLIAFIQMLLLLGFMMILAHVGVFFRDIKNMMQYITRTLFYLSPVLYTLDRVPENVMPFLYVNPLTTFIVSYRNVFLYEELPMFSFMLMWLGVAIILIYIGGKILHRFENQYAKVI